MTDREDWHRVVSESELDSGDRIVVELRGREIGVFNVEGEYHALLNYCPHQSGPSCEGELRGKVTEDEDGNLSYGRDGEFVSCPWHGWKFDIVSGENSALPNEYQIPTYDVKTEKGDVYVHV